MLTYAELETVQCHKFEVPLSCWKKLFWRTDVKYSHACNIPLNHKLELYQVTALINV